MKKCIRIRYMLNVVSYGLLFAFIKYFSMATIPLIYLLYSAPGFGDDKLSLFVIEHFFHLSLIFGAVGLPTYYYEQKKEKEKEIYTRWNGDKPTVPALAFCVVIAAALGLAISGVLAAAGAETRLGSTYKEIIIHFLSLGVLIPITAELAFRFLTLNRLRDQKLWTAIVIQACIGAVCGALLNGAHEFAVEMLLGVFLGFIYTRFRTIWIPVAAGIAFAVTNIAASYAFQASGSAMTIAAIIVGVVIAGACFFPMLRLRRPKPITAYDVLMEQRAKRAEAERREDEEKAQRGRFAVAPKEIYHVETVEEQYAELVSKRKGNSVVWLTAAVALVALGVLLLPTFELVDAEDNPYFGSWDGDTYTNERANIRFTLPEGLRRLTKGEIIARYSSGYEVVDFELLSTGEKHSNPEITFRDLTDYIELSDDAMTNEERVLEKLLNIVEERAGDVEILEKTYETVAGERYLFASLYNDSYGYGNYYIRELDGVMIVITTTFSDESGKAAALAFIDSIEPVR